MRAPPFDAGPEPAPEIDWFHPCPVPHATPAGGADAAWDWSFVDAVYCISLRSRPDRLAEAAAELARVGLASRATFHRPVKGPRGGVVRGIWEAHRACARHALAAGARRALILEDDLRFLPSATPSRLASAARAMQALPRGWRGFYLGHFPLRGWPVAWGVMRTRSACTHAYVADASLLRWLADTPAQDPALPMEPWIGWGLDSAFAAQPGMYAAWPMLAVQSDSPDDHGGGHKRKRVLGIDVARLRPLLLRHGMRPAQWLCLALSPLWLAFEALPRRVRTRADKRED